MFLTPSRLNWSTHLVEQKGLPTVWRFRLRVALVEGRLAAEQRQLRVGLVPESGSGRVDRSHHASTRVP